MIVYPYTYRVTDDIGVGNGAGVLPNVNKYRDFDRRFSRVVVLLAGSALTPLTDGQFFLLDVAAFNKNDPVTGFPIASGIVVPNKAQTSGTLYFEFNNPPVLPTTHALGFSMTDMAGTTGQVTTEFQYVSMDGTPPNQLYQGN